MGKRIIKSLLLLFLAVFLTGAQKSFAQQNRISIQTNSKSKQISFAVSEIQKAAQDKKYTASLSGTLNNSSKDAVVVKIVSDSASSVAVAKSDMLKMPQSFAGQAYSVRVKKNGSQQSIYILAGDNAGAMYGGLDVAEAMRIGTLKNISESDNKPFIEKRGIKFNIPLDLRTPSYSDAGDAAQQSIPDMWSESFWQTYMDELAKDRYNVLTLWSLHPFPSMVKIPEFPEVALNDVWRTKAKFDDGYSSIGVNYVRPNLLADVEIVKKITIDEKIAFWQKVMQMANDRGIEVYVFTWNMFTYGAEGKHGITKNQQNDTTLAYFRAAVREMVTTYPLLAGIGITAGESMQNNLQGEYANERWLARTYGEGIKDGLKQNPNRDFQLIHRIHQTALSSVVDAFKDYPRSIDVSLKYAIAHMYSLPKPPFINDALPYLTNGIRSWLTIRNDDIYSFRWANNDFARQFIKGIPGPEYIKGFYMGPDGYTWGKDYLTKGSEHPLVLQKQWYSFMLWGRLSYNPDLKDEVFFQNLQSRFPNVPVQKLYKPWSAASMVFPWITRYVWGDIDLRWLPEANISHKTYRGFYTVGEYIVREPSPGSNIRNIYLWAKNDHDGVKDFLQSPLAVADTLAMFSKAALDGLKALPARKVGSFTELDQTLGDIEAFGAIGQYYAAKMRAACSLAKFDQFSNEADRNQAIKYLEEARTHWVQYAKVYDSLYKPALYNRVGYVNVTELLSKVDEDITLAKNWKPGTIKYTVRVTTETPFRK